MTAENEKLRDEVQHWMKKVNKQPGVAAIPSHNNEVSETERSEMSNVWSLFSVQFSSTLQVHVSINTFMCT